LREELAGLEPDAFSERAPRAAATGRRRTYLKRIKLEGTTTLDRPTESDLKRGIGCDQVKSLTDFTP
jgi:hypothetical protein